MGALTSMKHFDVGTSSWITILKSSPPLVVKSKATYHFKDVEADVSLSSIVEPLRFQLANRKLKSECISDDPFAASSVCSTPSVVKNEPWDSSCIGDRPCTISQFPGITLKEVNVRMQWISDNANFGSLQKRYAAVYGCPYHSSTFHRHQKAWKWLQTKGMLEMKSDEELWKDLTQIAWKSMTPVFDKASDVETIDLTT